MEKSKAITKRKILTVILLILIVFVVFIMKYLLEYSHYTKAEVDPILSNLGEVSIIQDANITKIIPKQSSETGLIFYPGGKVDEKAYIPLLTKIAQGKITVVLIKMPFHLAIFDLNAANKVYSLFPEIKNWYIGGHSLGGAMACLYAEKNVSKLEGVILLASYSTADLSKSKLRILSLYGSQDRVLNSENVTKYAPNLPQDSKTIVINGGNHGYFGSYGEQKGDGIATISRAVQQQQTSELILDFINAK